jgi:hypothetical protein
VFPPGTVISEAAISLLEKLRAQQDSAQDAS